MTGAPLASTQSKMRAEFYGNTRSTSLSAAGLQVGLKWRAVRGPVRPPEWVNQGLGMEGL
jgi:hypothetical protein